MQPKKRFHICKEVEAATMIEALKIERRHRPHSIVEIMETDLAEN